MEKTDRKFFLGDAEYILHEEAGSVRLVRRDPVCGMRVESVFRPGPDSPVRMEAFKLQATRLVLEAVREKR